MNNEKTFIIEGLDCANCAAKVERKLQSMPQIDEAVLTFATKQLKIVSNNVHKNNFMSELEAICNSVESGVTLSDKKQISAKGAQQQSILRQNAAELVSIILGALFFAAGVIIEHFAAGILSQSALLVTTLVLFAAGYFILGGKVLLTSAKNISKGQIFDENFLMSIATIAAFCIGEFTEGVGVMLFYRIGELFENIAVEKSRTQIMDAVDMRPETVNLICSGEHDSKTEHSHEHEHSCSCGCEDSDEHEHIHTHEHNHEHEHSCSCGCEDSDEHEHIHTHEHEHEHSCGCGCEDSGEHEHIHTHEHNHEHEHSCSCGCEDSDEHEHIHTHEHNHEHDSEHIHVIPAEKANTGDILLIRPGDRIPLDGIIIEGESRIDTSPVTGEPVPVSVRPSSEVISGCINNQGLLKMRVTKPLAESMVTKILDSVENAAAGKPKIDKFITKFAKVYTPIVVILAVLTAIVPSVITGNWSEWITTAITFLVISCPCALVISVPLAFFAGIGAASRLGILFKGGFAIEALKNVKAVVMDKTGTLTKGNFAVQEIITADENISQDMLLSYAAVCESASTHPIAASIMEEAHIRQLPVINADSIEELSGMGIKAYVNGNTVLCGNEKLMNSHNVAVNMKSMNVYGTKVLIAVNGQFKGAISISDTIKPEACAAIASLKSDGLLPAMLTGDSKGSAEAVGKETGISTIYSQLMPAEKLSALRNIRENSGAVMFVGDGINDAPVLAGADVGAAMGSGADAAIEAADVIFMKSSVEAIPKSIKIAKATDIISKENVILALAVKLIVLLLGFAGFANIWAAVFADTGVAMVCILNSLRILWKKF